jgi:hypothetical protein
VELLGSRNLQLETIGDGVNLEGFEFGLHYDNGSRLIRGRVGNLHDAFSQRCATATEGNNATKKNPR